MSWMRGDNVVMGTGQVEEEAGQGDQPVQEVAPQVVEGEVEETAQGPALAVGVLEYPGGIFQDTQALGPYHK